MCCHLSSSSLFFWGGKGLCFVVLFVSVVVAVSVVVFLTRVHDCFMGETAQDILGVCVCVCFCSRNMVFPTSPSACVCRSFLSRMQSYPYFHGMPVSISLWMWVSLSLVCVCSFGLCSSVCLHVPFSVLHCMPLNTYIGT